jgi:hypothetical protein
MTQSKHTHAAAGLEALEPLVGKWHTEGDQLDGPDGSGAPYVAVETFEWLEGGRFLVHRVDGRVGGEPLACVAVIGRGDGERFTLQAFTSDGTSSAWQLSAEHGAFTLRGLWRRAGTELQVRSSLKLVDAGNAFESQWEYSPDGEEWRALLTARGTKAQPLPNASVGG